MSTFPEDFWMPQPIRSVGALRDLRLEVIKHNERRMPKWKFRFYSDLVCQIQPKISERYVELFDGNAYQYAGADGRVFQSKQFCRTRGQWAHMKFRLYWIKGIGWVLKPTCAGGYRTIDPDPSNPFSRTRPAFNVPDTITFRDRLVHFFDGDYFAHFAPERMLSQNCMCCGKGLTDPASMARMIGPECYGSNGLDVPHMYGAAKQSQ
jgi:hypothetical protein